MRNRGRSSDPEDELVPLLVPRSALIATMPRPLAVTQMNCTEIFGITPEEFTSDARAMRFPNKRRGHKRIARVEDAARFYLPSEDASSTAPENKSEAKLQAAPVAKAQPKQLDLEAVMGASVLRTRK
jgi:hypothetical protein